MVREFICVEFSSKNVILNVLMFTDRIGLSILVGDVLVGGGGLAIRVLWGMWSTTG